MGLDTIALIKGRRTVRKFKDKPVDASAIRTILEAGTWAPSAHNAQPWRFAVVPSQDKKGELATAMGERWRADLRSDGLAADEVERLVGESRNRIVNTPVVIVLSITMRDMDTYPDERRRQLERIMAIQSASACAQNILLAAHALGLGAGWVCAPLFSPDEARRALGLSPDWQPVALIGVGHPDEIPDPPARRSIDEVCVWLSTTTV